MPTESSAVVKIIEIANRQRIRDTGDPLATEVTKKVKNPLPPERPRTRKLPSVLVAACVVAAVGFGVYLGSTYLSGGKSASTLPSDEAPQVKPLPAAALAASPDSDSAEPVAKAAPVAPAQAEPAQPPSGETGAAPAVAPLAVTYTAEQLANTGFDLRVEPAVPAKVFLGGKLLGVAPLRVRNLLPGAHRLDLVPPAGFAPSDVTVVLTAEKPRELRVKLDRDGTVTDDDTSAGADDETDAERARRERREARREKRDAERKKLAAKRAKKLTSDELETTSARTGKLKIGAKPPCDISINGRSAGKTPKVLTLKAGRYRVTLTNREFGIRSSFKTRVKANATTRVIRDMSDKIKKK